MKSETSDEEKEMLTSYLATNNDNQLFAVGALIPTSLEGQVYNRCFLVSITCRKQYGR